MKRLVLALVLALAATAVPASADTTATTLYLHSPSGDAVVDRALRHAGEPGPYMDDSAPTQTEPSIAHAPTAPLPYDEVDGHLLLAHWRAPIVATLSNINMRFWARTDSPSDAPLEVQLYTPDMEGPSARAAAVVPTGGASMIDVSFGSTKLEADGWITVQFVGRSEGISILYDATSTPSALTFDAGSLPEPPVPPQPPSAIDPAFGRPQPNPDGTCAEGDTLCARMLALKSRSHVVIAVVDTGINPYHVAFARPDMTVHPSAYIDGFPSAPAALMLTQGAPDYEAARRRDTPTIWNQVERNTLYWIPGTNVIGAIAIANDGDPIIDDNGHGTGTASVSAGAGARAADGAPYGSNPEALLVIVEGLGADAVRWVRSQPWIDFVSGSYGDPFAVPLTGGEDEVTRPFVLEEGRTACFSAGNGLSRTGIAPDRYSSLRPTSGPSWVVTVGAASPRNGQDYWWHSVPVDVASYGAHWPAAGAFSLEGEISFGGTSNATPVACGVLSATLLAARRALGDTREGVHPQRVPASGTPASGLLADGVLTRTELERAVMTTARPTPFDPSQWPRDIGVYPTTPAYFMYQGYGLVNVASRDAAIDVVLGRAPMPERPDVDAWIAIVDRVRDALYPPQS